MIGLIYKDIKTALLQYKIILILLALYFGYSFMKMDLGFFTSMEPVLTMVLVMLTFGYDERSGWDKIACTIPYGRDKIVISRYFYSLLVVTVLAVLHLCVSIILKATWAQIADSLLLASSLSFTFMGLMFPVFYKFGSEKSRMVFLILFIGMMLASSLIGDGANSVNLELFLNYKGLWLLIALMIFCVSAWISCLIYRRKQFN
ncbi:MAG: ABC-2 transporter permease [Sphaerochaetaceae bacterium]|jgi:ABC-2 type transport system permease protein|nr:ABC-2 transporter permease [Sphaerochaetaceae bacterium]NLY07412.1 ABC-2 transporter permease [Spirochaetales bacterium]